MGRKLGKRIKDGFRSAWSPSQIMFAIFLEAWVLAITVIVTLKTVSNGSITVTYFWIASYVFFCLALLTLIRIRMQPKDNTTLKEIKEGIDKLIEMHTPHNQRDIGLINQQIRDGLQQIKISGGEIMPKSKPQRTLTKSRFMRILRKAAQPVSKWKHDQEETGTSESHPSDGYTDKCKSQDKTEGKEFKE